MYYIYIYICVCVCVCTGSEVINKIISIIELKVNEPQDTHVLERATYYFHFLSENPKMKIYKVTI